MAGGPPAASFGELLRQLRVDADLTQEGLAADAKVSARTISDLERGVAKTPHGDTVLRLARGLRLESSARAAFEAAARGRTPVGELIERGASAMRTLPRDIASFTGREPELREFQAAAGSGGVGIHAIGGMPGVGKTALAVHVARMLQDLFPDRQLFIDLHAHTPGQDPIPPQAALAGLLRSIGVDARYLPADLAGRAALWRDRMAGQQALLVLDNAASSAQVIPLLPGGEHCLVLVTSRRHLGDLPGSVKPVLLDTLPPDPAQAMFLRLAPGASTWPAADVAELARLAGYLPLAISLLARLYVRHPSWTLADLTRETRSSMLTLTAEQDSVAAAFEVSYRYLPPGEQQFFRLLSLHPGTETDAYAAAALAGVSVRDARGQLDDLHREGLLTEVGYRRYSMHDLIRRYARDCASADPAADRDQALNRLLDYYQHTAVRAEARMARQSRTVPAAASLVSPPTSAPDLPDHSRALSWARAERASLIACLDYVTAAGQHARVVALTAALAALLRLDGPWTDAIARHTVAVQAAWHLRDPPSQADALDDLGIVLRLSGDYAGATQAQQEALDIYQRVGDRQGQANALNHLGTVRFLTDDYPQAAEALTRAIDFCRDLGDRRGQADALNHLGAVQRLIGDYPAAVTALEEALGICRDLGSLQGQANALSYLGTVRQLTGSYPAAADAQQLALGIFRELGNRLGEANTLGDLGTVRRLTGDYEGATRAQQEALGIYLALGDRLGQGTVHYELGVVRRLSGDYLAAAGFLAEALAIFRQLGNRGSEAEVLNEVGTLHLVSGNVDQARACHRNALDLARAVDSSWDEAQAKAGLGRCALAVGQTGDARTSLRQALEIFRRLGAAESVAVTAELDAITEA